MELKPCPFCGGNNVIVIETYHPAGIRYSAICPECMATINPCTFQRKDDAVRAWNRRTEERSGEWIRLRKNYSKCSVCGAAYSHSVDWAPDKYCSECGAKLFWEAK